MERTPGTTTTTISPTTSIFRRTLVDVRCVRDQHYVDTPAELKDEIETGWPHGWPVIMRPDRLTDFL